MKYIIIILLFIGTVAHGQRRHNPYDAKSIFEEFNKEDSLEGLYVNDTLLCVIADTLPSYSLGESKIWRYMKLVSYYYDSSKMLRKISFRDGEEGDYYFYFKVGELRKARYINSKTSAQSKYYFTVEDNKATISEIEKRMAQQPGKNEFYETLRIGKRFLEKFNTFF